MTYSVFIRKYLFHVHLLGSYHSDYLRDKNSLVIYIEYIIIIYLVLLIIMSYFIGVGKLKKILFRSTHYIGKQHIISAFILCYIYVQTETLTISAYSLYNMQSELNFPFLHIIGYPIYIGCIIVKIAIISI